MYKLISKTLLLLTVSASLGLATKFKWRTFAFASSKTPMTEWKLFAWDKLTTVALFGSEDPDQALIDYAHQRDCKVVKLVNIKDQDLDKPGM